MADRVVKRTTKRYGVIDRATGMMANMSKGSSLWTNGDTYTTYLSPTQAVDMYERLSYASGSSDTKLEVVEVTVVEEITISDSCEDEKETPVYRAILELYNRHLPQYIENPDLIGDRDWKAFKEARSYLEKRGYPVER